jgi:hypothetical protein
MMHPIKNSCSTFTCLKDPVKQLLPEEDEDGGYCLELEPVARTLLKIQTMDAITQPEVFNLVSCSWKAAHFAGSQSILAEIMLLLKMQSVRACRVIRSKVNRLTFETSN